MSDNQPRSGSLDKTQVIVALLALIGVVITAACGFFGVILPQLNQGPSQPEIQATLDVLRTLDNAATAVSLTTSASSATPVPTTIAPTATITPTDVPTDTPTPTDVPTRTTAPTATPTYTATSVPTTIAPSATITPREITAIPAAQSTNPNSPSVQLQLFTSRGTLTLYVPESISLTGLTLVAVDQRPFAFTTRFDGLQLTGGLAPADSCYILRSPEGATEPIPDVCRIAARAGRVSIANISAADNFWYDSLTNQARAIGVLVGETPLTDAAENAVICPGGQPTCGFTWPVKPLPTSTSSASVTPPALQTAVMREYPCLATIELLTSSTHAVRRTLGGTANHNVTVRDGETIEILEAPPERISNVLWYRIRFSSANLEGYIDRERVGPSKSCPITD